MQILTVLKLSQNGFLKLDIAQLMVVLHLNYYRCVVLICRSTLEQILLIRQVGYCRLQDCMTNASSVCLRRSLAFRGEVVELGFIGFPIPIPKLRFENDKISVTVGTITQKLMD